MAKVDSIIWSSLIFPDWYISNMMLKLVTEYRSKSPFANETKHSQIFMARHIKDAFSRELRSLTNLESAFNPAEYMGYKIVHGYELERIIICHEMYPISGDKRLFHSVKIEIPK